jgi:hypothetical protein
MRAPDDLAGTGSLDGKLVSFGPDHVGGSDEDWPAVWAQMRVSGAGDPEPHGADTQGPAGAAAFLPRDGRAWPSPVHA